MDEDDEISPLIFEDNVKTTNPSSKLKLVSAVGLTLIVGFFTSTIILAILYFKDKHSALPFDCPNPSLSPLGKYAKASVAADNIYCSEIGRNVLLKGGNAVDAAIAALFCIGIMDAHSAGIGGGHFMTIFNSTTKKCHVIDAREVAPAGSSEDMYVGKWDMSQKGWLSVAVPGELHGYWTAYNRFGGAIEWKKLLEPTIELLEEGYPTSHALAKALKDEQERILKESTMNVFLNPVTGKLYEAGEQIVTRQKFTELLKSLALSSDPVQLFYNSSLTQTMADEIQKNGGILTMDDFQSYQSKVYEDDEIIYTQLKNGRHICGPPPPAGSAVAQAIIKILDEFDLNEKVVRDDPVGLLHRFIEASKFAYAARSRLGDINFNQSALHLAKYISSSEYAQKTRSLITDEAHPDAYYGGSFEPVEDHGTTHISVIDSRGNAVSVTSTVNLLFGAGIVSESTGIVWNDEMDDFSSPGRPNYFGFLPSKANFIKPGKRPMSSASPIIIYNSNNPEELLAVGAAGGSKIISAVANVALRALWLNENVKQAVDAARVHNQLTPNTTSYEDGFPIEYQRALERRGHQMVLRHNLSVVTTVERNIDGNLYANSDFRKGAESAPAGY